jgi:hypothetical protein
MEIAGMFVGVASLGLQICGGFLLYYQSWKESNESVADLYQSIKTVENTLQLLHDSANGRQLDSASIQGVRDSMQRLEVNFGKLDKKLQKIKDGKGAGGFREQAKAQLTRVSYPFKESTILKLRDIIHDQKCDLLLALHVLQM